LLQPTLVHRAALKHAIVKCWLRMFFTVEEDNVTRKDLV